MARTYGVRDAVSGKTIVDDNGNVKEMTYDEAARMVRNICHCVGTDYFVIEVSF